MGTDVISDRTIYGYPVVEVEGPPPGGGIGPLKLALPAGPRMHPNCRELKRLAEDASVGGKRVAAMDSEELLIVIGLLIMKIHESVAFDD